jgi:hypothetical protein
MCCTKWSSACGGHNAQKLSVLFLLRGGCIAGSPDRLRGSDLGWPRDERRSDVVPVHSLPLRSTGRLRIEDVAV